MCTLHNWSYDAFVLVPTRCCSDWTRRHKIIGRGKSQTFCSIYGQQATFQAARLAFMYASSDYATIRWKNQQTFFSWKEMFSFDHYKEAKELGSSCLTFRTEQHFYPEIRLWKFSVKYSKKEKKLTRCVGAWSSRLRCKQSWKLETFLFVISRRSWRHLDLFCEWNYEQNNVSECRKCERDKISCNFAFI